MQSGVVMEKNLPLLLTNAAAAVADLGASHRFAVEKAMAAHSSTLAWKILWTEEPGGLQSMGSLRVDTIERLHFPFSL